MEAENKRRAGAYLTDNVVIVRQVVSVSLGGGRRGVAQFPYVWLGAVGRGGNREAIRLRLAALRAVLTGGGESRGVCEESAFSDVALQSATHTFKLLHTHTDARAPTPPHTHPPVSAEAPVLVLEVMQPFGKEDDDHKEEDQDQRGHAHHHAHHLELRHCPITARAFVPDIVLHVTPGSVKGTNQSGSFFETI